MTKKTDDLKELKGIGAVMAQRLRDAGFDSFAKIAKAGEEELQSVKGVKSEVAADLVAQASLLAAFAARCAEERAAVVQERVGSVRQKVQTVTESALERFQEDPKARRRLNTDMARIGDALDRMAEASKGLKRATKGLMKAEKRMETLGEADLKKVHKGLKKTSKTLLKALA